MSDSALASPIGHVRLFFRHDEKTTAPTSLSAVEQIGKSLWLAGDESSSLERLISEDAANYDDHVSIPLGSYFPLPVAVDQEIDLEALSWDKSTGRLWLAGSHSWRRKQPKPDDSNEKAFDKLAHIDQQKNRYLLGSIKLAEAAGKDGIWEPVPNSGLALPFTASGNSLTDLLKNDRLLGPFMPIPSKDNGFDIEGMAVKNDEVLIGLRGPVLRGWASILHLKFDSAAARNNALAFEPSNGQKYLHHVLDLDGLGVRDLCVLDDDVLILAGPTMSLDGPVRVFLWRAPFSLTGNTRVDGAQLERLFDVPWGNRMDHAEGLTVFKRDHDQPRLLVVYDSPREGRLHEGKYFEADLFRIP